MKVGFIGLGTMGKPMAKRLLESDHELTVFNRSEQAVLELVRFGAHRASSATVVAQWADIVVTMLPDTSDVALVFVDGKDSVLQGIKPGMTVIDMSSILPSACRGFARAFEKRGADFLDAPVSGGPQAARHGKLSIMVGGKKSVFLRHERFLEALGTPVYMGTYGKGQEQKLINQIIVAEELVSAAHAIFDMEFLGIKPIAGTDVLLNGLAATRVLERKWQMMISRTFTPAQFRAALHLKDLRNAAAHFSEGGYSHNMARITALRQRFETLVAAGYGDEDHSAVMRIVEKEMKV